MPRTRMNFAVTTTRKSFKITLEDHVLTRTLVHSISAISFARIHAKNVDLLLRAYRLLQVYHQTFLDCILVYMTLNSVLDIGKVVVVR